MSMKSGKTPGLQNIRAGWYGVVCVGRVTGPRKFHLRIRRGEFAVDAGSLEVIWRPPYTSPRERIMRAELAGKA